MWPDQLNKSKQRVYVCMCVLTRTTGVPYRSRAQKSKETYLYLINKYLFLSMHIIRFCMAFKPVHYLRSISKYIFNRLKL